MVKIDETTILNKKEEKKEDEHENIEEDELPLDEFEIEQLLLSDEILPTEITYYNKKLKKKGKMEIFLKGISSTGMSIAANQFQKSKYKNKTIPQYIISQCWHNSNGNLIPLSSIRQLDSGVEKKLLRRSIG